MDGSSLLKGYTIGHLLTQPGNTLARLSAWARRGARAIPLARRGTPDDIAGVLQFFVSDLSRYITGQCLSVCGGAVLTPS